VDEDYADLAGIRGMQMRRRAALVTDCSVIEKILGIMARKFPQMKEMPANPDFVFFRIDPQDISRDSDHRHHSEKSEWTFLHRQETPDNKHC
jgi:nitrate/TMAO reductase-like tetraheme cytochrome c subunit